MTRLELAERLIADIGLTRSDELVEVIASDHTCDVEACPGSGKTTALALKVALEVALWTDQHRGMLVLSHTNVARREIEKRGAIVRGCARILRPPHFLGTIQSFVDHFLAFPYMRGLGLSARIIDDDVAGASLHRILSNHRYAGAVAWAARGRRELDQLEFGSKDGTITLGGQQLGIGQATRTYRQLLEVKERCTRAGVFRYGDMYAYAERSLTAHPWIIELLRNRFQVILVDEMQDTAQRQAQLLDTVFPRDRVRVHRFGDSNQSIYGSIEVPDGDGEHFPSPPILHLRESRRFGAFIAGAVSSISANGQAILGGPEEHAAPHTILLYTAETVGLVLDVFAQIAASMAEPGTMVRAHAVGLRKGQPTPANELRANLATYLPTYEASAHEAAPDALIAHICEARKLAPGEFPGAVAIAYRAIADYFIRWNAEIGVETFKAMKASLDKRALFGSLLLDILLLPSISHADWREFVSRLTSECAKLFGHPAPQALDGFLRFIELQSLDADNRKNTTVIECDRGISVEIRVDTIHSVKGETHTATLVLETYSRAHDLKGLMPHLSGRRPVRANEPPQQKKRLKTIFVGMSRPKSLVCLALQRHNLEERDAELLQEKGWRILSI